MTKFTLSAFSDEASSALSGQIEALKRNGIEHFEPRGIDGKNISEFTVDEAKQLKAKLDEADISTASIGSPYGKIEITDDFEPHFAAFKNTVEVAKVLEAPYIRIFSFYFKKGESYEEYRGEVIRRVKAMADYAKENGVTCCLENEKGIYGDIAERNRDVLDACKGSLSAVFDPANYIQCGVKPLEAWELVGPYVEYVHVKDAYLETGEVVPAGKGDGSLPVILRMFAKNEDACILSVEPHLTVFEGLSQLENNESETAKAIERRSYQYPSRDASFDAAVSALKDVIAGIKPALRVGIIGVGNMGSAHLRAFVNGKVPDMQLVAIADLKEDRREWAKEQAPDITVFNSGDELIESGLVDVVTIATPHYFHPPLAIKALKAGLHVLTEKPAGVYTKQVREMNEAAAASDKVFAIMYNQRTNPCYRKLREMVKSGQYGEIMRVNWIITSWFRTQSYYNSGGWRATWEGEGGGVLLNQCPHNLDLWQWICGMPSKVSAVCHEGKWHNIEVEDDVTIYAEYPNGATGVFITSTGDAPGTNRLEITMDKAKLICDGDSIQVCELSASSREFCMNSEEGFSKPKYTNYIADILPQHYSQHVGVLNAFAGNILRGEPLYARGEEGINGLTISNAAHLSSWLGKPVELPVDEDFYYEKLQEKIANSTLKKVVVEKVQSDMSKTYGS